MSTTFLFFLQTSIRQVKPHLQGLLQFILPAAWVTEWPRVGRIEKTSALAVLAAQAPARVVPRPCFLFAFDFVAMHVKLHCVAIHHPLQANKQTSRDSDWRHAAAKVLSLASALEASGCAAKAPDTSQAPRALHLCLDLIRLFYVNSLEQSC